MVYRRAALRLAIFMRSTEHTVQKQQVIGETHVTWCQEQRIDCLLCRPSADNRHHSAFIDCHGALAGATYGRGRETVTYLNQLVSEDSVSRC